MSLSKNCFYGIALLLIFSIATTVGCKARAQVALDKAKAQIDKLLGELDVKQKEIEIDIKSINDSVEKTRSNKNLVKAKLDQNKVDLTAAEESMNRIAAILKEIGPKLNVEDENTEVEVRGKKFKVSDLKAKAQKWIDDHKDKKAKYTKLKSRQERLNEQATRLEKLQKKGQDAVDKLKEMLADLKEDRQELKEIKETAGDSVGEDTSLLDKVAKAEEGLKDLKVRVNAQKKNELEKLDEAQVKSDLDEFEKELSEFKAAKDVSAEINNMFGSGKDSDDKDSDDKKK